MANPYAPGQILDYADQGVLLFLEQFKDKRILTALVRSYLNRVQELEQAIWEVIQIRGIDNSIGVGLDQIGNLVGRQRLGLGDDDYRIALRCEILINRSSGTPENLIAITGLSIPDGLPYTFAEAYPATDVITVDGGSPFNIPILFDNLVRAKNGGVKLLLQVGTAAPDHSFTFSDFSAPEASATKGFSDYYSPTGGYLAGIMMG